MPSIVAEKISAPEAPTLTPEGKLPVGYAIGDRLVLVAWKDDDLGGNLYLTGVTGWTEVTLTGDGNANTTARVHVWAKVAASTTETEPTINTTNSDDFAVASYAIRGEDATTTFPLAITDLFISSSALPGGTLSGTNDNNLCLFFVMSSAGTQETINEVEDYTYIHNIIGNGTMSLVTYYNIQDDGVLIVPNSDPETGVVRCLTLVIGDDGTGENKQPYLDDNNVTPLYHGFGDNLIGTEVDAGATIEDPILDITAINTEPTVYSGTSDSSESSRWVKNRFALSFISSQAADALNIIRHNWNGTVLDFSANAIFAVHFKNRLGMADALNLQGDGFIVVLEDSVGEWAAYNLTEGEKANRSTTDNLFQFQPSSATPLDTSTGSLDLTEPGSVDLTDIAKVSYAWHHSTLLSNYHLAFYEAVRIDDFISIGGGGSLSPIGTKEIQKVVYGSPIDCSFLQGDTQLFLSRGLKFAAGCYADLKYDAIEFVDTTEAQTELSNGRVGIVAPSSGTLKMACTINGSNQWDLIVPASSTATMELDGGVFLNANEITLRDPATVEGASFVSFTDFYINDCDMTAGATFDGNSYSNPVIVTSKAEFEQLQNCTFKNFPGLAIQITGNHGAGSWSASGMTVANGEGSYDIEYTGTGTLTIAVDSSSGFSQLRSNATVGTLTISPPIVSLTINSDTASSLIRYFEDDSQTATSTTGTSLVYTYPDTDPIDIEVLKQGYVPVNRQDVTPYNDDYNITLDFDEAYNLSHDLVITTDYTYNRTTKVLAIVADQEALDVRSALADLIRTNSSYYNTPLLMDVIGGLVRVDLIDGMTCSDMTKWKGAGSEVYDAADSTNPIERWCAVKTVGGITGATTHYRQTSSGDSTALTLTNNVVNEALQYWSDPDHDGTATTDTSEYLLIKAFLAGSKQDRVDILAASGDTALRSTLYQVGLANEDHGYSGADPGITADLTLVAGGTVGGKVFAYKIVDGGTNSGSDIANQLNYNAANNPNTVIAGGTGLRYFELPDMVIHNASAVETEYGYKEGATPTLVGFYVERSGADHPDFTRFQADDGTYYLPAQAATVTISDITTTTRVQLYDTANSAELYNGVPGSTSYQFSETYSVDRTVRVRLSDVAGATAKLMIEAVVGSISTSSYDISYIANQEDDTVYNTNAIDGSSVTGITIDDTNDLVNINIAGGSVTWPQIYAYEVYWLNTATGIQDDFAFIDAIDTANYVLTSFIIKNTSSPSVPLVISSGYGRDSISGASVDLVDTSGGTLIFAPDHVVPYSSGSGLTAGQDAKLTAINSKTDPMTYTVANELDVNIKSVADTTVTGTGTELDPWNP